MEPAKDDVLFESARADHVLEAVTALFKDVYGELAVCRPNPDSEQQPAASQKKKGFAPVDAANNFDVLLARRREPVMQPVPSPPSPPEEEPDDFPSNASQDFLLAHPSAAPQDLLPTRPSAAPQDPLPDHTSADAYDILPSYLPDDLSGLPSLASQDLVLPGPSVGDQELLPNRPSDDTHGLSPGRPSDGTRGLPPDHPPPAPQDLLPGPSAGPRDPSLGRSSHNLSPDRPPTSSSPAQLQMWTAQARNLFFTPVNPLRPRGDAGNSLLMPAPPRRKGYGFPSTPSSLPRPQPLRDEENAGALDRFVVRTPRLLDSLHQRPVPSGQEPSGSPGLPCGDEPFRPPSRPHGEEPFHSPRQLRPLQAPGTPPSPEAGRPDHGGFTSAAVIYSEVGSQQADGADPARKRRRIHTSDYGDSSSTSRGSNNPNRNRFLAATAELGTRPTPRPPPPRLVGRGSEEPGEPEQPGRPRGEPGLAVVEAPLPRTTEQRGRRTRSGILPPLFPPGEDEAYLTYNLIVTVPVSVQSVQSVRPVKASCSERTLPGWETFASESFGQDADVIGDLVLRLARAMGGGEGGEEQGLHGWAFERRGGDVGLLRPLTNECE